MCRLGVKSGSSRIQGMRSISTVFRFASFSCGLKWGLCDKGALREVILKASIIDQYHSLGDLITFILLRSRSPNPILTVEGPCVSQLMGFWIWFRSCAIIMLPIPRPKKPTPPNPFSK